MSKNSCTPVMSSGLLKQVGEQHGFHTLLWRFQRENSKMRAPQKFDNLTLQDLTDR
jgi:hypothetical protein